MSPLDFINPCCEEKNVMTYLLGFSSTRADEEVLNQERVKRATEYAFNHLRRDLVHQKTLDDLHQPKPLNEQLEVWHDREKQEQEIRQQEEETYRQLYGQLQQLSTGIEGSAHVLVSPTSAKAYSVKWRAEQRKAMARSLRHQQALSPICEPCDDEALTTIASESRMATSHRFRKSFARVLPPNGNVDLSG